MKDSVWDAIFAFLIIGVFAFVGIILWMGGTAKGYTEGYCTAIGGTVLNPTQCNVNDRVVTIP
jgi:hypothetical protein